MTNCELRCDEWKPVRWFDNEPIPVKWPDEDSRQLLRDPVLGVLSARLLCEEDSLQVWLALLMFTAQFGGVLICLVTTIFILLYVPILFIFYQKKEFNTVHAYQFMFWTGIVNVGQLIIHDITGLMAITQQNIIYYSINKIFGATIYAFWYAMLLLITVTNLNRLVSVVFPSLYDVIFSNLTIKIIYGVTVFVFLISWIVKLIPYSNYVFDEKSFKWRYGKNDIKFFSRSSHYIGTYSTIIEIATSTVVYSTILIYILKRKKTMKCSEILLTTQNYFVSLVLLGGFIYWEYADIKGDGTVLQHFIGIMIWVMSNGLNSIVHIAVNRRVRISLCGLIPKREQSCKTTLFLRTIRTIPV
ncbi:hypothetical protein DICVIV_03376 [Dictyocaulus viviparus]|uniref:7TM GPCR serpentine receptor class x (Srx) domain-containing protein n=1 Tax=Dictyocaulus viviparus TaxID=29172 RepID=A0A0D8Y776_DICVI|nr:hypothetical protein DICVIV_03376 [Dictyocaulus viviparus]